MEAVAAVGIAAEAVVVAVVDILPAEAIAAVSVS
jgi:hypothetical protein